MTLEKLFEHVHGNTEVKLDLLVKQRDILPLQRDMERFIRRDYDEHTVVEWYVNEHGTLEVLVEEV